MEFATEQEDAEVYISNGDVQRMLRRIFPASTRILSIRPDTLRFAYNHGRFQTIPVKLSGTLNASSQHYIQTAVVEPDSVRVYAPKAVLDTMQAVYTDAFVLDEVNNSGTYQIALRKQKFIKHEPEQVKLKVSVGYYTEKAFQIPIIGLNFPAGKKFRAFPEKVTIKFRVESGRYNNIKPENFVLSTTYEELLQENSSGKLMLSLKNVPEGVSNVSISPQEVDYLIEQVEEQDNNQ